MTGGGEVDGDREVSLEDVVAGLSFHQGEDAPIFEVLAQGLRYAGGVVACDAAPPLLELPEARTHVADNDVGRFGNVAPSILAGSRP